MKKLLLVGCLTAALLTCSAGFARSDYLVTVHNQASMDIRVDFINSTKHVYHHEVVKKGSAPMTFNILTEPHEVWVSGTMVQKSQCPTAHSINVTSSKSSTGEMYLHCN